MFCKKVVFRNLFFTGKHLCQSLFFNKVAALRATFIKKETLAQVFSCEFCEISKNTFSYRTHPVAASEGRPAKCKCRDLIHLTPYIKQDQIIEESKGFTNNGIKPIFVSVLTYL